VLNKYAGLLDFSYSFQDNYINISCPSERVFSRVKQFLDRLKKAVVTK
jgi:hypothetical protein